MECSRTSSSMLAQSCMLPLHLPGQVYLDFASSMRLLLWDLALGFLVLVHISSDPQYSFTHVSESGHSVFGQLQRSLANNAVQILNTI